nr:MAG: hypothetical protein [Owegonang virus 30]
MDPLSTLSSSKKLALEGRLTSKDTPQCPAPLFSAPGKDIFVNELTSRSREGPRCKTMPTVRNQSVDKQELSLLRLDSCLTPPEKELILPPSLRPPKTPVNRSVKSSKSMGATSCDTLKEWNELEVPLQEKEISKQQLSGVLDQLGPEKREQFASWPQEPIGSRIVPGGVATIRHPTTQLLLTSIDATSQNSVSSCSSSTDILCQYKVREAIATLELAKYLFPAPSLLTRPGRVEQKRMYNNFLEELKALLSSFLEVSVDSSKEMSQFLRETTPSFVMTRLYQSLNQLVSYQMPRRRTKRVVSYSMDPKVPACSDTEEEEEEMEVPKANKPQVFVKRPLHVVDLAQNHNTTRQRTQGPDFCDEKSDEKLFFFDSSSSDSDESVVLGSSN